MSKRIQQFAGLVARLSQFDQRQLDAMEVELRRIEAWRRVGQFDEGERRQRRIESGSDLRLAEQKGEVQSGSELPHSKDWPRAPVHRLVGKGTYIVTAGTYNKHHHFGDATALDYLEAELLSSAQDFDWQLEAWAVFSNHYHFVGHAMVDAASLGPMTKRLHSKTACWINCRDGIAARQVWYNFWETKLTYEKSYQARLHYVHQNPVKHGLVRAANQYRWCSAAWFERAATPAQVKTIYSFKTDKIKVLDDFDPLPV